MVIETAHGTEAVAVDGDGCGGVEANPRASGDERVADEISVRECIVDDRHTGR